MIRQLLVVPLLIIACGGEAFNEDHHTTTSTGGISSGDGTGGASAVTYGGSTIEASGGSIGTSGAPSTTEEGGTASSAGAPPEIVGGSSDGGVSGNGGEGGVSITEDCCIVCPVAATEFPAWCAPGRTCCKPDACTDLGSCWNENNPPSTGGSSGTGGTTSTGGTASGGISNDPFPYCAQCKNAEGQLVSTCCGPFVLSDSNVVSCSIIRDDTGLAVPECTISCTEEGAVKMGVSVGIHYLAACIPSEIPQGCSLISYTPRQ